MNMKKIMMVIMILAALTGVSHADIVYITSDGSLGVIPVGSTTSIDSPALKATGLGADLLVGSYTVGSTPYVMVVDRVSNNELGDTATIFNASNLTTPKESVVLTGVFDTKTFASSYNGRSIFFASRGNKAIVEFETASIDIPINAYIYNRASEDMDYEPELVDMAVGTNFICALFRARPDKIELFSFDGQLIEGVKRTVRGTIRNDATSVSALTANRFAIGAEYGISLSTNIAISTLLSSDYPVKSVCRDTGNGLYYIEQSDSGNVNVCHYYSDRITRIDSMQGTSDCQLVRDSSYNILAAMIGGSIYLYDMGNDELIDSFDSYELGGIPTNITVSLAEHDSGSGSSSNCDVSCIGMMLLGVLGIGLLRHKR